MQRLHLAQLEHWQSNPLMSAVRTTSCGYILRGTVEILPAARHLDPVITTLTNELNAVTFRMANWIDSLHEMETSGCDVSFLIQQFI